MEFGNLKLKRCLYGWMLYSGPYIGECFDRYGEYSESEVATMRELLAPGDIVIDVGANIGDLTLPLARYVGDAGRVFAIESHAEVFNVLCANLALNGITNTRPINAFVADAADANTVSAWGEHAFVSQTWGAQRIALDDLDLPNCKLIKVDVDGHELEVLKSGEMAIERHRPFLYIENDVRSASSALIAWVLQLGYDLYWHPAPIFRPDNYLGNPVNHWSPTSIISKMMLGVPSEAGHRVEGLRRVHGCDDWWPTVFVVDRGAEGA